MITPFFTLIGAFCTVAIVIFVLHYLFSVAYDFIYRLIIKRKVMKRTDLFSKEVGRILDDKGLLSAGEDAIYNTTHTLFNDVRNISHPLSTCEMCEQTLDEVEAAWKKMLLHMFYLSVDITWQRKNLEGKK